MFKKYKTEKSHSHKYSDPLLSTLLKHLWQWLQPRVFFGMTLQVWHTCIWRVSPILLFRSTQALSSWKGSVAAQLFSGHSRDVRSGSSPSSGWATQGHSETCPELVLCCLGCVPRSWGPECSAAGFHQGSLCTLCRTFFPRSWLTNPFRWKTWWWWCHHHAPP